MVTLVIPAGGKGTRLSSINKDLPKCLSEVGGTPILAHHFKLAKKYQIKNILVLTGVGADVVQSFVEQYDTSDLNIKCIREGEPLGTAGGFHYLESDWLDTFLVVYGDLMVNIDINRFINFHYENKADASLFVHPNSHPFDSDLFEMDDNNKINVIHKKPHKPHSCYGNNVNAAVYLLEKTILEFVPKKKCDWVHDVFDSALNKGLKLFAYRSSEYVKDMGTPERLEEVRDNYKNGIVLNSNYEIKRPAIFLDRDGTLNEEVNHCSNQDDLHLIDGVADAVKLINKSKYLAIVISNQSVIARNMCSLKDLKLIHNKLECLLGEEGAYLDDIYYCPHHPDKGYPEENVSYKIDCNCRKPKPGLLYKAMNEHNIDLEKSIFIGDTTRDVKTAKELNIKSILLKTGYAGKDETYDVEPDFTSKTLSDALDIVFRIDSQ